MLKVIILRGVSGSGKTTKARELMKEYLNTNPNGKACRCSADDFFVDLQDGVYKFDPKKLNQAHAWCRGKVDASMSLGTDLIIVDNTSTRKWEYQPYLDLAEYFEYEVEEIVVGDFDDTSLETYARRNKHGVPLEAIERMAERFE